MAWQQLTIEATRDHAPAIADWLERQGAEAVTMMDAADQPLYEPALATTPLWELTLVTGLFPAERAVAELVPQLASVVTPLPPWKLEPLADQPWERAWMDHFQPQRFGERLWVVPSWYTPPDPTAVNLLLDPGLAFGTGTHPTTQLCLLWLDSVITPGVTVVDYGCGSGILAVAAACLGAERVLAVDNDPQALTATRENAARNGVAERIEVCLPQQVVVTPHDWVVANILAGPLVELAPRLIELTRPGGGLALAGLLSHQAAEVTAAYADALALDPPLEREGWVRISGRRH